MKILFVISLLCLLPSWAFTQTTPAAVTKAQPLSFGITQILSSKELGENRVVNIYLPPGYNPEDTLTYPVIYIIDGGADEDFFHIAGIVRYNNQPWINRFPTSIVVGIENVNRRRDCTFAVSDLDFLDRLGFDKAAFPAYGGSERYIAFIQRELIPFIAEKYKGTGERTIVGESLAGLLATEILLQHPNLFQQYIIISPSLWWGNEQLLKRAPELLKENAGQSTKVYIAAAQKNEDTMMYKEAEDLKEILRQYGSPAIQVFYDYLPEELHSTIMHQAVYNAFKMMYPHTEYQH